MQRHFSTRLLSTRKKFARRISAQRDRSTPEKLECEDDASSHAATPSKPSSTIVLFFHRIVVIARIALAWTLGALAASKYSVALIPFSAVIAHLCLERLLCRGAARRLWLLSALLVAFSGIRGFVPLVIVGLGTFAAIVLFANADAGAAAAIASAALAAAPRRSPSVFVVVLLLVVAIAPSVKSIILRVRGQAWLERGQWLNCEYQIYNQYYQRQVQQREVASRRASAASTSLRGDDDDLLSNRHTRSSVRGEDDASPSKSLNFARSSRRRASRVSIFTDDGDFETHTGTPSLIARYQPPRSPSPRTTSAPS